MLFAAFAAFTTIPETVLPSSCNVTLSSDVLAYSQCRTTMSVPTVFDFSNRTITVLGAPLDPLSCSRYVFRMENTRIKNVNFFLNATIEHDKRCPKQYFGIFDTENIQNFSLENVLIGGNVYID